MKVLVTLDGSSFSEAALETALKMAQPAAAEVHLLTVGEPPPLPPASHRREQPGSMRDPMSDILVPEYIPTPHHKEPVETYDQTIERAERELLQYLQSKAVLFKGLPVKFKVAISKDAAEEIINYAKAEGVDLIVMATHGRSGLAAVVQGSVAREVVRSAPCPVTLVHPKSAQASTV